MADRARPDPRLTTSWCGEGVAHDHGACGALWDTSDPADVEAAARWADDHAEERRAGERVVYEVEPHTEYRIPGTGWVVSHQGDQEQTVYVHDGGAQIEVCGPSAWNVRFQL